MGILLGAIGIACVIIAVRYAVLSAFVSAGTQMSGNCGERAANFIVSLVLLLQGVTISAYSCTLVAN